MAIDFEWYDRYAIGIEEIDVQHKRFLKLMKKTYELKKKNLNETEVFDHLDELTKYANFHFASEETFMEIYEYPELSSQVQEHNKIKNDLLEKVEKIKKGDEDLVELLFYLLTWFMNHTSGSDKKIGKYITV